ncbi:MAG: P-loop NTPase fold protein [Gemmatimonadota bacterium]|nr:P-loop NTPase fold protein [Gemmatimonadota bacterium]
MSNNPGNPDRPLSIESLRDDEPIRKTQKDLLSRDQLVEALARQIEATDTHQPIVIGLNAPWGTGKSSFLHLLSGRLESGSKRPDETTPHDSSRLQPIIVNFNPWLYGNVEQLIRMFFAQLADKIGANAGNSNIGKLLKEFGPLIASLCPVVPPGTAALTKAIGNQLSKQSISDRKEAIDRKLESLGRRVIVFVDDIDRLEPDVTELLFRTVRLCADFKNITYVLAFDSAVVERHLDRDDPVSGRRYLEKIIHVSYNIPRPGRAALRTILTEELDDVRRLVSKEPLNPRRYEKMLKQGMATHFSTVRGIKRYVNALRLSLPPVKGRVDLIDFFVIELCRVVYPEVYAMLSASRYRLIGESGEDGVSDDDPPSVWLATSLKNLEMPPNITTSLTQLICGAFPELREGNESAAHGDRQARWSMERRVCCRRTIDRYFLFTIPSEELSPEERVRFATQLTRAADTGTEGDAEVKGVLCEWSRIVGRKGRTRGLLQALCEVAREIGKSNAPNLGPAAVERIAQALCTIDPEDDLRLRDCDNDGTLLGRIIHECTTYQQGNNQVGFLRNLIEYNRFVVTKVFQYLSESQTINEYSGTTDEVVRDLGQRLSANILQDAAQDEFWRSYRWYYLLSVDWSAEHGNNIMRREIKECIDAGVREVIATRIGDRERLLSFCEACRDVVSYMRDADPAKEVLPVIRRWIPDTIEQSVRGLQQDGAEETAMAAAYLDLLVAQ